MFFPLTNYLCEIHRFHKAVQKCKQSFYSADSSKPNGDAGDALDTLDPISREAQTFRCHWALDNADLVVTLHAMRVELQVRYVMANIVPATEEEPFLYWLRFEFGVSGNPHAHGKCFASGNPHFEMVVQDEDARQHLLEQGRRDVENVETWAEAEVKLAAFFDEYVREMHPCKDMDGARLYDFVIENLQLPHCAKPQTFNLREELDRIFDPSVASPEAAAAPLASPDLAKRKEVLAA